MLPLHEPVTHPPWRSSRPLMTAAL
jgi:hypothetical protein